MALPMLDCTLENASITNAPALQGCMQQRSTMPMFCRHLLVLVYALHVIIIKSLFAFPCRSHARGLQGVGGVTRPG